MNTQLLVNAAHIREYDTAIAGDLASQIFEIKTEDRLKCLSGLNYSLHVRIVDQSLLVRGRLKCKLECQCDRCLYCYDLTIETDDICHYFEIPGDRIVDITNEIREDILIDFPQKYLCSTECLGLCLSCGQNLNIKHCHCDRNEDAVGMWSKLDQLEL